MNMRHSLLRTLQSKSTNKQEAAQRGCQPEPTCDQRPSAGLQNTIEHVHLERYGAMDDSFHALFHNILQIETGGQQ